MKPLTTQTGPGCAVTRDVEPKTSTVTARTSLRPAAGRPAAFSAHNKTLQFVRPSVRHLKHLTTLRPARATKNINSDSNYSTVNVVAAGRWPASSNFRPTTRPCSQLLYKLKLFRD